MNPENIFEYVANVGFPIILSIFLLFRIEVKLEKLSESITDLNKAICLLSEKNKKADN